MKNYYSTELKKLRHSRIQSICALLLNTNLRKTTYLGRKAKTSSSKTKLFTTYRRTPPKIFLRTAQNIHRNKFDLMRKMLHRPRFIDGLTPLDLDRRDTRELKEQKFEPGDRVLYPTRTGYFREATITAQYCIHKQRRFGYEFEVEDERVERLHSGLILNTNQSEIRIIQAARSNSSGMLTPVLRVISNRKIWIWL